MASCIVGLSSTYCVLKADYSNVVTSEANVVTSKANVVTSEANVVTSVAKSVTSDAKSVTSDANVVTSEIQLQKIALPVASTKRVAKKTVENTIIALCSEKELSANDIALLLNRNEKNIRNNYLNNMCKQGMISLKYQNIVNHPDQKYKAK